MVDRAARLAVHALDFAVLVLVVGNDAVEVLGAQRLAGFVLDDGPEHIEQLALIESEFAVAADGGDGVVEIVEDDILLRYAPSGRRTVRFSDCLPRGGYDCIEEGLQVWLLAVAR